jgi:Ca-activated chloride channel family protein
MTASSPVAVIPSWFISLALHVLLLAGIASGLKSCEGSLSGQQEGALRKVGIYVKQPNGLVERSEEEADASNANATFPQAFTAAESRSVVDDVPPAELTTPSLNPPHILGSGVSPSASSAIDAPEFILPGGALRPTRVGELARGETAFFGIRDTGTHFVYLLDASGSMAGIPILAAKAELKKSIAALDATQQFQIIFYNDTASVMQLRGAADAPMIWATEVNKTLARQSINNVVAGLGTDHMPALKKALALRPEVIYFLTDADSVLRSGDLAKIKRINQGRARIHCIEFGEGAYLKIKPLNFLKRLARQSGGTYHYCDVTQFRRKR